MEPPLRLQGADMRTAKEWLAVPEDELGVELAKVLTPGPWKHKWVSGEQGKQVCKKCHTRYSLQAVKDSCPVPDPIKVDWNVAMEWFRESKPLKSILRSLCGPSWASATSWMLVEAQPHHYLIAAAMAAERTEE